MKAAEVEPTGVRVLHKTLDILETIKTADAGYKLADLARKVDFPKATVYRILTTLEGRGYLDRRADGSYRMAKKLFDLQRTEAVEQVLNRLAQPLLERLVNSCKETVNLGLLDAGEVVVINTVESPQAVRMSSKIGNRRLPHSTALGKVLLAGMPDKEVARLIRVKGLPKLTEATLTTKVALMAEIQKVRQQGWALDNQENEIEGRCIGAPVEGPEGRVIAAVSVSGPVFRMDMARAKGFAPELKSTCAEISRAVRAHWALDRMPLARGTRLGPYEIVASLGAGGMGEVYRARDTRLDREVAVKVLPSGLARHPDRLARFEREAKVLASLNHPHIAQLYGVEGEALIMELVEGQSPQGPLPIGTCLDYARQIADALEAAHEKGIVHRDLKPANVKITSEGVLKVLDFGLAAVAPGPAADANPSGSPTMTMAATQNGAILGTAGYMSPEQASGKPADKRADIWSFGVVLWEMLTGHRLFEGETVLHTLADVLRGPIDFDKLPRETPPAVRNLLRRCLDRNVKSRLRDIGEARVAIDAALAGDTPLGTAAPTPGQARWRWLGWIVAALLVAYLGPVAYWHLRERPPAPALPVRFQIPAPENATLTPYLSLSPDGRKLAFLVGTEIWVHSLESGETHDLTTAEGTPFWSPDSRLIGYPSQGRIKTIEADGASPQSVMDYSGIWEAGAWSQAGAIVFGAYPGGLFRVPNTGGVPVQITAVDPARHEQYHCCPSFLPDGRHFVYLRASADARTSAIYLGSVNARPEEQNSKPLVASSWSPGYAPSTDPITGYLLFMREGTLLAQPFDNRRLELKGRAAPVAGQVGDNNGGAGGYGAYSASANDILVFWRNAMSSRQLTWYDRTGKVLGTVGEPGDYRDVDLSPDGTRVALSRNDGKATNIWLLNLLKGGASTRLTFGSRDTDPVWSPDGTRILFTSKGDLYQKPASGVKDEEVVLKSGEEKYANSWSRDGRFLLYVSFNPKTRDDIWVLPMEGSKKPVPFLVTESSEIGPLFSSDGHWIAYSSDESGQYEVYVRSFSMNAAGTAVEPGGKWQVSNGNGFPLGWRSDGRELYYHTRDGVMAVEIATSPVFRAGTPQPLGIRLRSFARRTPWEVTADGKRFLAPAARSGSQAYTVVMNWQAGLKKADLKK